ncbi:MAG: L-threonylcarbamoyladenylate synthase [Myxococcota bacterium]
MSADLSPYLEVLRQGGVVACPTETWMGLLADATRPDAVAAVVRLKGRAPGAPIAVLLPDAACWDRVARDVPAAGRELAAAHWPGPLTLVARARDDLPSALVRDGKVGVRVPGPSPALDLVRAFGGPLTATSANRTGEPAARDAEGVRQIFANAIKIIPGTAPGGAPSTVLDVTTDPPSVLRAGAIGVRGG